MATQKQQITSRNKIYRKNYRKKFKEEKVLHLLILINNHLEHS